MHPYLTEQYLYERNTELDRLAARARTDAASGRDGPRRVRLRSLARTTWTAEGRDPSHPARKLEAAVQVVLARLLSLVLPRRARQAVGRRLVQVGGRVALDGCPTPAPCPWCDLAFPAPGRREESRTQVPC